MRYMAYGCGDNIVFFGVKLYRYCADSSDYFCQVLKDSSGNFLKATLYSTHFQTNVKNLMKNLPSQYRPLDAPYEAGGLSNEFT